jgi:sphingolipid delta-4 desaturase
MICAERAPTAFLRVDYDEPHRERTRTLLAAHPEARELCGNAPASALLVGALVALQLGLAWLLRDRPPWLWLLVSYSAGAVATHALWVLIHECAHNLVFAGSPANALLSILANLPIVFPSAIGFRKYHLLHHAYQGREDLDADLPSPIEARLVRNRPVRKALWLLFFFAAQALRVRRLKRVSVFDDGWYLLNLTVQVAFIAAVAHFAGLGALAYLALSSVFAVGLHPVGARWIQEHYLVFPGGQETFSYYGPLNAVALNVGYHNEHHDLMRVPWHRLPRLKSLAPELYEPLHCHRSWTRLLLRFIFDRSLSLYSRATRGPGDEAARAAALAEP